MIRSDQDAIQDHIITREYVGAYIKVFILDKIFLYPRSAKHNGQRVYIHDQKVIFHFCTRQNHPNNKSTYTVHKNVRKKISKLYVKIFLSAHQCKKQVTQKAATMRLLVGCSQHRHTIPQ